MKFRESLGNTLKNLHSNKLEILEGKVKFLDIKIESKLYQTHKQLY
jgi:hypothetical protein